MRDIIHIYQLHIQQSQVYFIFNKDKNSRGTIFVKEFGRSLDLIIKTTKILRCENNIEIEFLVEGQTFNYKIEVK